MNDPVISVEYEVLLACRVNVETGEIISVIVFPDGFNGAVPLQFYAGEHPDETLPEYLPTDHPLAVRALEAANRVQVTTGDLHVPYVWDRLR